MSWTPEKISQRFEECVWVFDRLPNAVQLGFGNYWPEIKFTPRELSRQESKGLRLRPLPDAIDRAEETLRWFQWVNPGYRNLIWLRAQKYSWREIGRKTGFPKTSAQRYWHQGLLNIINHLQPGLTHTDSY